MFDRTSSDRFFADIFSQNGFFVPRSAYLSPRTHGRNTLLATHVTDVQYILNRVTSVLSHSTWCGSCDSLDMTHKGDEFMTSQASHN